MRLDWTGFLRDSAPADHGVQVYQDLAELAESVSEYLAAGLDAGEPAIVISTPEHWQTFSAALDGCGWGPDDVARSGLVQVADAEATLAAFMVGRQPSGHLFRETVGALLDEVESRFPGRRIRAFGEMVDVLCAAGNPAGADALERLWHELLHERPRFTLLCGYELDPFDRSAQLSVLPAVCDAHSHVLPAEDAERFQHAVDHALHDVLGPNASTVYRKLADASLERQIPSAQLALMWITANMPAHAEEILGSARKHYEHDGLEAA